jgi:secreted Zn-dependent insulinase-like peptidase
MYGKLIERSDRVYRFPTSYIYCTVCDSLVFIPESAYSSACLYRDIHFKRCINGDIISNEHARRKEILQSIDEREFSIWQYKQYILQEETKINRLRLELFSQSTSHSEKDKLASVSYDHDSDFTASYENYAQSKATIAKNTMPSAPNFEPACISITFDNQEVISPTSYQSSNCKSDTGEIFISSQYVKQPKGTVLRLRDGTLITIV